jgi:putative serine/threonine protein kinase
MDKFLNLTAGEISLLREKVPSNCADVDLFARGKRGIIFKADYRGKVVVVKVPRPSSDAPNTSLLEARYLEKANDLGIGPKLYASSDDYVIMEFIEGSLIGDFLRDISIPVDKVLYVLLGIFHQLVTLDKSGLNKFELTNPYKHIIVKPNFEPILIDFERARYTQRPKNVTQFTQYLASKNILPLLQEKGLLVDLIKFKSAISDYLSSGELHLEQIL